MISTKVSVVGLGNGLDAFARKQVPFALALALTETAVAGQAAERAAMTGDLDRPRPFTVQQGVRVQAARKSSLAAAVYVPPIQSHYLSPEIDGGAQVLNRNNAVLRPIDQATDQYGNLPRGTIKRLARRKDIYIGRINGIAGVWQRLPSHRLKLLVRFSAPVQVRTRLPFGQATMSIAPVMFGAALRRSLVTAIRTAR